MNDYKFGNFVCLLREKKGMTQAELGTLLGVTAAAVSKWENGSSKPRTDVLFRLAEILEVMPEELIAGEYINSKLEDSEAVKQINERYKYLKKVDLFNNGKIKARRIVAWMIDWILVGTIVIFASGIYAAAVKNIGITKNDLAAIGMVFMILIIIVFIPL